MVVGEAMSMPLAVAVSVNRNACCLTRIHWSNVGASAGSSVVLALCASALLPQHPQPLPWRRRAGPWKGLAYRRKIYLTSLTASIAQTAPEAD